VKKEFESLKEYFVDLRHILDSEESENNEE